MGLVLQASAVCTTVQGIYKGKCSVVFNNYMILLWKKEKIKYIIKLLKFRGSQFQRKVIAFKNATFLLPRCGLFRNERSFKAASWFKNWVKNFVDSYFDSYTAEMSQNIFIKVVFTK